MPWIANPVSTHGTGCSLAAALAAELALGRDLPAAVRGAKAYVHDAIARSFFVGENCGVLGFALFRLHPSSPHHLRRTHFGCIRHRYSTSIAAALITVVCPHRALVVAALITAAPIAAASTLRLH